MTVRFSEAALLGREDDTPCPSETNQAFLRRATRDWHDRVDAAYTRFDLRSRVGLTGFLARQATAVAPLERQIAASGASAMLVDWELRQRGSAIAADLAHLGSDVPPGIDLPDIPTSVHGLGALYVLEGSRLGGRVLMRAVASSPDPDVRAATRFLGHPNPGGWTRFLTVLNSLPPAADNREALRAGAVAAFAAFLPDPEEPAATIHRTVPALSIPVKHETARTHGEHAA